MLRVSYRTDFAINKHDYLFFDTNVWINLFVPSKGKVDTFTDALQRKAAACYGLALEKEARIFTSSLVISEFINRYLRIMFSLEKSANPGKYNVENAYKEVFRKSDEYKGHLEDVLQIVEMNILDVAKQTDDAFNRFVLQDYCKRENREYLDFNDYCIEHICRERNYKLVTADTDFRKANAQCEVIYIV